MIEYGFFGIAFPINNLNGKTCTLNLFNANAFSQNSSMLETGKLFKIECLNQISRACQNFQRSQNFQLKQHYSAIISPLKFAFNGAINEICVSTLFAFCSKKYSMSSERLFVFCALKIYT